MSMKIVSIFTVMLLLYSFTFTVTPIVMDLINISKEVVKDTDRYYKVIVYKKLSALLNEDSTSDVKSVLETALIYAKLNNDTQLYNKIDEVIQLINLGKLLEAKKELKEIVEDLKNQVNHIKLPDQIMDKVISKINKVKNVAEKYLEELEKQKK